MSSVQAEVPYQRRSYLMLDPVCIHHTAPACCAVDVSECRRLFGSPDGLLETIAYGDRGPGKTRKTNEMIGNSGSKSWEGTEENGLQLETGMYIIWMEVFSEDGTTERFKQVVVLSR